MVNKDKQTYNHARERVVMQQAVIPSRWISYNQSPISHMWEWIMLKWANNQVIIQGNQACQDSRPNKQIKSPCLGKKRYPLIDQLNATFSSTSVQAWSSMSPVESPICGPAFFTCVPTLSTRLAFYLWKIIFWKKVGVATYFIFILKGK